MTAPGRPETSQFDAALFVDDAELHRRLACNMGKDAFSAAIKQLEREGFPPKILLFRRRYFPACVEWLDEKYGKKANGIFSAAQPGPENFSNAPSRKKAGLQDRPQPAPILDRQSGAPPRHHGLPGQVHSIAARTRQG